VRGAGSRKKVRRTGFELPLVEGADSEVGAEVVEQKLEARRERERARSGGVGAQSVEAPRRWTWWSGGSRARGGAWRVASESGGPVVRPQPRPVSASPLWRRGSRPRRPSSPVDASSTPPRRRCSSNAGGTSPPGYQGGSLLRLQAAGKAIRRGAEEAGLVGGELREASTSLRRRREQRPTPLRAREGADKVERDGGTCVILPLLFVAFEWPCLDGIG
jgi:hypothetical protein